MAPSSRSRTLVFTAALLLASSCTRNEPSRIGTREQRSELFDSLIAKTAAREAWSPPKNDAFDFDPLQAMKQLRDEVVSAQSEAALFYARRKTSNARRDRHLSVSLVPGGLRLPDSAGVGAIDHDTVRPVPHAPIKVQTDFGQANAYELFVSDVAAGWEERLQVGDRVLAVNGVAVRDYLREVEPYIRYSTVPKLWWSFAEFVPQRTAQLPPHFHQDRLRVKLARGDEQFAVSLPYLHPDSLRWSHVAEPNYKGFGLVYATTTYDLYVPEQGQKIVLLRWHGFRENLVQDIDSLVAWARTENRLDDALIVDATRSRGGSKGAYAVQRMVSVPFKVPFGNLRISDVIPAFIADKQADYRGGQVDDSGVSETVDDGAWLVDWLVNDVQDAYDAGDEYSNNVPFKLAHAPKESDGVLQPAPVHFRGPLVVFSGPHGGSHLDQFVATVVDNDLGYVIGTPAGGYSNTWEWEETLTLPNSDQPLVEFMWSIGHTLRPNGDVLEGNPASVHEFVPVTSENVTDYYDTLLQRALAHVDRQK